MRKKIYFIIYSVLQMIMGIVNFVNGTTLFNNVYNMACTLTFPNSNVAIALRKITGSNDKLYASYLSKTLKKGELSEDFVE